MSVRNRMPPDARREAILDTAQLLFMERGFVAVTVADVLDAAEISKGGFYHHFRAKEDLLTGIVARMTRRALDAAHAARDAEAGDALARLNSFMMGSVRWKADNIAEMRFFMDMIAKPGNDILYARVFDATAGVVVPVLEDLIAEGVAEGTFDVDEPRLTAEMIVALAHGRRQVLETARATVSGGGPDRAARQMDDRMRSEGAVCDRLLGLPAGSVSLSNPADSRRILTGLVASQTGTEHPATERRQKDR